MVLQVLVALHYLVEMSILARFGIILQSVSFWQGLSMLTLWLGQYCCNTETEDPVRVYQFMHDLIACRDWYNRDSRCILSRNEICDVINSR